MIDYSTQIVTALSTILKTYYELSCNGNTPKPCITYCEHNNRDTSYGETIGYSELSYSIKIWALDKATIETKSLLIDKAMRTLGFHRISSYELTTDNQICKIMVYEAQAFENYNS